MIFSSIPKNFKNLNTLRISYTGPHTIWAFLRIPELKILEVPDMDFEHLMEFGKTKHYESPKSLKHIICSTQLKSANEKANNAVQDKCDEKIIELKHLSKGI